MRREIADRSMIVSRARPPDPAQPRQEFDALRHGVGASRRGMTDRRAKPTARARKPAPPARPRRPRHQRPDPAAPGVRGQRPRGNRPVGDRPRRPVPGDPRGRGRPQRHARRPPPPSRRRHRPLDHRDENGDRPGAGAGGLGGSATAHRPPRG
jgi:hypothetical protein